MAINKLYSISFNEVSGLFVYFDDVKTDDTRAIPDWLPEAAQKAIAEKEVGRETFMSDGDTPIEVAWTKDVCWTHEESGDAFEGWTNFEEILQMVGGIYGLSEEQVEGFKAAGEEVEE